MKDTGYCIDRFQRLRRDGTPGRWTKATARNARSVQITPEPLQLSHAPFELKLKNPASTLFAAANTFRTSSIFD